MCFICMQLANQLELCLHKHSQFVASAACIVASQEFHRLIASLTTCFLTFYCDPYSLRIFCKFSLYVYT